jgi:hypothetical protein
MAVRLVGKEHRRSIGLLLYEDNHLKLPDCLQIPQPPPRNGLLTNAKIGSVLPQASTLNELGQGYYAHDSEGW